MSSQEDQTQKASLPKNTEWSSHPMLDLYQYQGFWYPGVFLGGMLNGQELDTQLSSSDIVLCSSPKTGTTWLKALAFAISTRTRFDPLSEDHPILTTLSHDLIPYIEENKPRDLELPLLSTHMPYSALPKPILDDSKGCKIVYICRNPNDAFVSLWHFLKKICPPGESYVPIDKAFDLFCQGVSANGPYWDHVLEYWKASLDHPEKVLFLKYEEMMEDAKPHVKKLAEFMGLPFSDKEETDGVLTRIVEMCSFGKLSRLEVNRIDKNDANGVSHSMMFRKAVVGDWRNHLTDEMGAKLDAIFQDKLGEFGLKI